jgi:hypothetical protein
LAVNRVRDIITGIEGFASLHPIFRPNNFGLSRNVIDAATYVLNRHGEMIMVEDDICVAPNFLKFMRDGLARYREERRVSCLSGYWYPVEYGPAHTFFLRGAECWGWATWSDRWTCFNPNGTELLAELESRKLKRNFDFDGAWGFTQLLQDQIAGRVDSWAIRWHAACFLKSMLTLYPARSLVQNIGFDGVAATHCEKTASFNVELATGRIPVEDIEIEESVVAREALKAYFRRVAYQSNPARRWPIRRVRRILSNPQRSFRAIFRL